MHASFVVHVAVTAVRDVSQINEWIALNAPNAAQEFTHRLMQAMHSLSEFPRRCPVASDESEVVGSEVRVMRVGRYRVLYRIENRQVTVLRVRHASRGPMQSLED